MSRQLKMGFHAISLLMHDEVTAARELTKIGYQCIAVRPRLSGLDPNHDRFVEQMLRLADAAKRLKLDVVYDLDAQYLHDPAQETGPSLAVEDASETDAAQAWIEKWIAVVSEHRVSETDGDLITFSTGPASHSANSSEFVVPQSGPTSADEARLERLASRLDRLAALATESNVRLAIRPVFGHAIATVAQFERLQQWLHDPTTLSLAADVGEMLLGGEFPVGDRLSRNTDSLACVYLCEPDTQRVRDRRVGTGDVDLLRVVNVLRRTSFTGPAIARVQGHSENGLQIAEEAWERLAES